MRVRHDGNVIIFDLEGQLDFETTVQFRDTCVGMMKKMNSDKVIFNIEKLRFVGSSGINQFVRVLKEFHSKNKQKPKICNASIEFSKIIRALQTARNPFEFFEEEKTAVQAFSLIQAVIEGPKKLPRKKKLDN